jgi:hypothetical protein
MAIDKLTANDRSKEKLKGIIKSEITQLFENALDFAHVACPPSTYPQLRSKILRVGNNCIRNLQNQLKHFDIEFKPTAEDVVEIQQSKK